MHGYRGRRSIWNLRETPRLALVVPTGVGILLGTCFAHVGRPASEERIVLSDAELARVCVLFMSLIHTCQLLHNWPKRPGSEGNEERDD